VTLPHTFGHGTSLALFPLTSRIRARRGRVLRITRIEGPGAGVVTLRVEGRIVGEAVGLVEQECRRALQEPVEVRVDLVGVAFIDGRAVGMLRRLCAERLRVMNCSPFVEHLLAGGTAR
jgi:anti-anti-sigma regulatory factor